MIIYNFNKKKKLTQKLNLELSKIYKLKVL